jgi:hypothetical protein
MEGSRAINHLDSVLWKLTTLQFSSQFSSRERAFWKRIEIVARGAILAIATLYCYNQFNPILPIAFNAIIQGVGCVWISYLAMSLVVKRLVFVTQDDDEWLLDTIEDSQEIENFHANHFENRMRNDQIRASDLLKTPPNTPPTERRRIPNIPVGDPVVRRLFDEQEPL